MIKKTVNFPFNNEIILNPIYIKDSVVYRLTLEKDKIGDCNTMIFNIYQPNGKIEIFNKPIVNNEVFLPFTANFTGEYEMFLWSKNGINNTQIHYGKINIRVKDLISNEV